MTVALDTLNNKDRYLHKRLHFAIINIIIVLYLACTVIKWYKEEDKRVYNIGDVP